MDLKQKLAKLQRSLADKYKERSEKVAELETLRAAESPDEALVESTLADKRAIDTELDGMEQRAAELRAEIAEDEAAAAREAENATRSAEDPDEQRQERAPARVGAEERTYREDKDPKGDQFLRDVLSAHMGSSQARERLSRSTEEIFDAYRERGIVISSRAVTTADLTGFAVPEYLTDMYAPAAKAGAPFIANANQHDLPETGMNAYLTKITTATTVDEQSTQGTDVDETDIDDTLITVPIFTVAGSQSVARQVIDRAGMGLDVTVEDLIRSYFTDMDSKAINRASTGLDAAATDITYTDASPTALELYAKILSGALAVETAMLDQGAETLVMMHPRRWRWLQNQFVSTWPMIAGRNGGNNGEGKSTGAGYGDGIRGYLPSDDPVIADANIATGLGTGTNEDQVFVYNKNEAHVWLDNDQPLLIKAEQTQAKKLLVDLVVYGYAATCFSRYSGGVQVIGGTGLVTPTF